MKGMPESLCQCADNRIELPKMLVGHVENRLVHERIEVNVFWCHENYSIDLLLCCRVGRELFHKFLQQRGSLERGDCR